MHFFRAVQNICASFVPLKYAKALRKTNNKKPGHFYEIMGGKRGMSGERVPVISISDVLYPLCRMSTEFPPPHKST
jgi:hypothetical protein